MLSYNQIISLNKTFADNHYVIQNFGNGERWQVTDHNQTPSFKYPLMWMEDLPNTASKGEYSYAFRVWFVTRVESPKSRGTELLYTEFAKAKSDMIQCAQDLASYWVQDVSQPTLDVGTQFSIEPFTDQTPDNITGCYMDIRFSVAFTYDSCIIPIQ